MNGLSFADSIIWRDTNPYTWWDGKVYCDIVSRIKSEFNIGLPAAGVGVCRFLADATNPDPSYTDLKHTRFRRNMIDLFLGIGLPLINMGLKMIVNPTRYWIQGVEGCDGVTDLSWPSILLYHIWCPVLSSIAAIYSGINCLPLLLTYVVIFLRHWWVRRRRLNEEWGRGTRNGISKAEFRRLQFTVLSVICFYFPFSLYGLVLVLKLPRIPYSWKRVHGARWWIIALMPLPKANLAMWVIPLLAITSFLFIGTTRDARRFCAHCVEWTYDHLPKKVSAHLSGMRKISETCKEQRIAKNIVSNSTELDRSMNERYVPHEIVC
jgi:pheromone a factor receptor